MNVSINSQVQSPFVRTLEAVPTKGGSFTHHIPDNVPPVDKSKIIVKPSSGTVSPTGNEVVTFDIPQHGYLNKAVLRVRTKLAYAQTEGPLPTGWATTTLGEATSMYDDGALALVKNVTLNTRNRPIERRYGRQIYADIVTGDESARKRKLQMLRPHFQNVTGTPALVAGVGSWMNTYTDCALARATTTDFGSCFGDLSVATASTTSGSDNIQVYHDSYVELPFSCFDSLASNYNTRFVEPMSIKVDLDAQNNATGSSMLRFKQANVTATNTVAGAAITFGIENVDLICYFTNYHDLTEQDIRDANFKADAPAVVFGWDVREESATSVPSATADQTKMAVDVRANNIAKQILVLQTPDVPVDNLTNTSLNNVNVTVSGRNQFMGCHYLELTGSGQTLYGGSTIENVLVDRYDYPLSTWSNQSGNAHTADVAANTGTLTPIYKIDFGLSQNPTYNSGCLGLQTISNPQVGVTHKNVGYASKIYVYVKHHSLIQIDSGTGAISRSIDA